MSDLSDFIRRVYDPEIAALQEKLRRAERAFQTEVRVCSERTKMLQAAEARAQKAEAEWEAWQDKALAAEAVVEAARRLLHEADEDASPEIGEFPLDAWLNLVDAMRAYDEPPTEQTDFDWRQQEC
jgi:molecular chaperone GrpE (heat shock protein)